MTRSFYPGGTPFNGLHGKAPLERGTFSGLRYILFFPHHYPLALAVNNPPRFIFYHARSTDFEEKIEGL